MRYCILSILLSICHVAIGQEQVASDMQILYRRVVYALAADSMKGRLAGTADEIMAGDFLSKEFRAMAQFHPVSQIFNYRTADTGLTLSGRNIYCYIDNHADSTILLGAHYDHIGFGGSMSKSYGKTGVHPGADDNASGVALLLGLAGRVDSWVVKKYNYLLVGFAAHEVGLYGSTAFYKFCKTQFPPICEMLNFDMVGRLDSQLKTISIYSNRKQERYKEAANTVDSSLVILTDEPEKIPETDCKAFAAGGVECLSFTTGIHEDYHKLTDDPFKINFAGIWVMQQLVEAILRARN